MSINHNLASLGKDSHIMPMAFAKENIEQQFHSVMLERGLACQQPIAADGKLHRFHVEGDTAGGENGWYVLHNQPKPAGAFGCWKRGISENWRGFSIEKFSPEEHIQIERQLQAAKALRDAEQAKLQAATKQKAQRIWDAAIAANTLHAYLLKKKVAAYGIRQSRNNLVIPLYDAKGEIHTLQFISPEGKKSFLPGGAKKHHFFMIGNMDACQRIYLCEGYATGATIYEAIQEPVVIAFDASNLLFVAENLKQTYPHAQIIICADNDQWSNENTGVEKAQEAARVIQTLICIPDFQRLDITQKPTDFNDLMLLAGMEEVKRQIHLALEANIDKENIEESNLPPNYFLTEKGLFYCKEEGLHTEQPKPLWLCSPLQVCAYFRNVQNEGFGLVLEFADWDGIVHQYLMPFSLLEKEEGEYRSTLADKGLRISGNPKAQRLLKAFFKEVKPKLPARLVYRTGWYEQAFILPHHVYGDVDERLLLQRDHGQAPYQLSGSLEDWQTEIAKPCAGNSRLVFAISCAFAAPLLFLTGDENGGFHFRGASSTGKTTALLVAASVWGGKQFLQRWRATTNGLEALAALHNDSLLCLDELAQVDAKEAGEIAYMLANGSGKQRAGRSGSVREKQNWRLLFLSTGEIALSEHLSQLGKYHRAGQEVRLVDIAADAGKCLGLFETIPEVLNANDFAVHLKEACQHFYGTAADAFLKTLVQQELTTLLQAIRQLREDFLQEVVTKEAHGQVLRVARRFALVAAAGELATNFGVTTWNNGEAIQAAKTCFEAWLSNRGGMAAQEIQMALAQVRHFFELHGDARFASMDAFHHENVVRDRAGYRKGNEFYVLPEVFKKDICKSLDARNVAKWLMEKAWILPDGSGKSTKPIRLPQGGVIRCYHFTSKVLEDEL
ncbi:MAG: inner rane protein [Rickettsiaceae bacterium]|jgi:putative DNA primase/helicase|nr:inner rane protein [Rickettsiaceae bacterium]